MEKPFPHNLEAEAGVLGSIMIDPEAYDLVSDTLQAADFYRDAHRMIYEGIVSLRAAGIPADYTTLCDDLELRNKIDEVGGASYITSLINQVPTSGNVEYYANIVARSALARRLITFAGQVVTLAHTQDGQMLEKASSLLTGVERGSVSGEFVTMADSMIEYMARLDYLYANRGKFTGVPSGFADLDMMTGGFQKSDLIILAGRPSMGKSALAFTMAYNAAMQGKSVAIFTLEMNRMQLNDRLMSIATGIPLHLLKSGWIADDQWDKLTDAAQRLSQLPLYINDIAGNPLTSMNSQLRRLTRQHGPMDEVIVDYLGLVGSDQPSENRVQEVNKISKGLKNMAREFNVPVLSLAQLSRKVEDRPDKHPQLADLRDSGAIEEDADLVMFVYREEYYAARAGKLDELPPERRNVAEIAIAKHRNGPTTSDPVQLYFNAELTGFYNLEQKLGQGRED
jgi:replicative DNA helicase